MKRALVLGGGGSVGLAWETAMLAGLLAHGVDARDADVVVGTSAGSIVGTWVAQQQDLAARATDRGRTAEARPVPAPADPSGVVKAFQLWGSFDEMTPERCAQVGAVALQAKTATEAEWLAGFVLESPGWPAKPLLICAVDCESGTLRVFTKDDGVPLNLACAASCSVPGLFPPVTIEGRPYTDGGVRSWTSADVVLPYAPARVLIVAPAGVAGAPGVRGLAARQVFAECELLKGAGIDVRLVTFDDKAASAGANLMDAAGIPATAEAGFAHAARIAEDVGAWWTA